MDVYFPSYFHWNGKLPYQIAENIMRSVWNIEPEFNVSPTDKIVESDLKVDLKGLKLLEDSVKYIYKSQNIKNCWGSHCIKDLVVFYERGVSLSVSNNNSNNNRRLLLLSDSFGNEIAPHFIRGFSQVDLISLNNLKDKEYVAFFRWI